MYSCTGQIQREAWARLWEKAEKQLPHPLKPTLYNLVTAGHPNFPASREAVIEGLIHTAGEIQTEIDQDNFRRGFLADEWEDTIIRVRKYHKLSSSHQSPTVIVIKLLWEYGLALWQYRNDVLHSQNNDTQLLHNRISCLYENKTTVHPRDRYLFHSTVNDLLQKPKAYLLLWIQYVEKANKQWNKVFQSKYPRITRFFRPKAT